MRGAFCRSAFHLDPLSMPAPTTHEVCRTPGQGRGPSVSPSDRAYVGATISARWTTCSIAALSAQVPSAHSALAGWSSPPNLAHSFRRTRYEMTTLLKHLGDPSQKYIAPANLASVPHVVLRERHVLTIPAATVDPVLVFGNFRATDTTTESDRLAPVYGHWGAMSANIGANWVYTSNLQPNVHNSRARLSALKVSIRMDVPSNGFFPSGLVHVLSLPTNVDANSGTYGSLTSFITTRSETRTHTGKRMLSGVSACLKPNDLLEWAALRYTANTETAPVVLRPFDGWGNVIVYRQGTANSDLIVTLHACWSVEYTRDVILQQLHTYHPGASERHQHDAARVSSDDSWGTSAEHVMEGVGEALGITAAAHAIARAAPVVGGVLRRAAPVAAEAFVMPRRRRPVRVRAAAQPRRRAARRPPAAAPRRRRARAPARRSRR